MMERTILIAFALLLFIPHGVYFVVAPNPVGRPAGKRNRPGSAKPGRQSETDKRRKNAEIRGNLNQWRTWSTGNDGGAGQGGSSAGGSSDGHGGGSSSAGDGGSSSSTAAGSSPPLASGGGSGGGGGGSGGSGSGQASRLPVRLCLAPPFPLPYACRLLKPCLPLFHFFFARTKKGGSLRTFENRDFDMK